MDPNPNPSPRSDPSNPYPTTFVQADTSSFKQVVQMLTGSPNPHPHPHPHPPTHKPKPTSKLYERRTATSFKPNLRLTNSHIRRSHDNKHLLSPTTLDFPSLTLSPVTPLNYDLFINPSPLSSPNVDSISISSISAEEEEDKAIKDKGFFLHPVSPIPVSSSQPRLLPLFPVTSPNN